MGWGGGAGQEGFGDGHPVVLVAVLYCPCASPLEAWPPCWCTLEILVSPQMQRGEMIRDKAGAHQPAEASP